MNGIESVAAERRRQVEVEGWTPEHDDEHRRGELGHAAQAYLSSALYLDHSLLGPGPQMEPPALWPGDWDPNLWKPKSKREDLVRAAALIVAEIDRLDRADG